MTSLLRMKKKKQKKKQYGRQIDPFSFLSSPLSKIVEHLFRQTNILVVKGFYKSLKRKSSHFNLQHRSIYTFFKLLAQFLFASALKME